MRASTLFLWIVLSELVGFSLSLTTYLYCADHLCMLINNQPCCGLHAGGPKYLQSHVIIKAKYLDQKEVSVTVVAGFLDEDPNKQTSIPTCSATFKWPAWWKDDFRELYFTDQLGLRDFQTGETIEQKFQTTNIWGSPQDAGDDCPNQQRLPATTNPYHLDPSRKNVKDLTEDFTIPSEGSIEQGQVSTENLIGQPVSYVPSSEPAVPVANPVIGEADGSDKVVIPSIPSLGNSFVTLLTPVEMASTIDTNFNTVGSTGGGCTGYDCVVPSFEQFNPNAVKRGTPTEFQA